MTEKTEDEGEESLSTELLGVIQAQRDFTHGRIAPHSQVGCCKGRPNDESLLFLELGIGTGVVTISGNDIQGNIQFANLCCCPQK